MLAMLVSQSQKYTMKTSGASVIEYSALIGKDVADHRGSRQPFQLRTCGYMVTHAADAGRQPHQGGDTTKQAYREMHLYRSDSSHTVPRHSCSDGERGRNALYLL